MRQPIENRKYYWGHRKNSAVFAEAVGIAHFLVANMVMLFGQLFHLFEFLGSHNGGVQFVYNYIDLPVYFFVEFLVNIIGTRGINLYLGAELVILISSALYAFISYLVFDLLSSVINLGK